MKKTFKPLLILLSIIGLVSCGSSQNGNNSGPAYLKLGETTRNGNLSVTIKELNYTNFINADKNESYFKLDFILHSYYENTVSLNHQGLGYGYSVVFDNNSNNGGLSNSTAPSSIAPNADEMVSLTCRCFKDWESAVISYKDNNSNEFTFGIKSEDYPNIFNNNRPILKSGEEFTNDANTMKVKMQSITRYNYDDTADITWDQMVLSCRLTSLILTDIDLPSVMNYSVSSDGTPSISWSTNSTPTKLSANGSVTITIIIKIRDNWTQLMFGNERGGNDSRFMFGVLHSDFNY